MDVGPNSPVGRLVDRALSTRRGNLYGAIALAIASVLGFVVTRALASELPRNASGTLWLPLVMAIVSVPAFGAIVLLAGSRFGFPDGLRYGVLTYIVLGLLVVGFGIPNGLPGGIAPAGPFWPFFVLWLHACMLGFGLWPCPGGV